MPRSVLASHRLCRRESKAPYLSLRVLGRMCTAHQLDEIGVDLLQRLLHFQAQRRTVHDAEPRSRAMQGRG